MTTLVIGVDYPFLLVITFFEAYGFVTFTAAVAAAIWGPEGLPRWASACISEIPAHRRLSLRLASMIVFIVLGTAAPVIVGAVFYESLRALDPIALLASSGALLQ